MSAKVCEQCGQLVPPAGPRSLSPTQRRIYDFVARHPEGVTSEQIKGAVYGGDPDGGPESGNIVSVHISKMRPALAEVGVTIRSTRGPGATYRLVAL